MSVKQKNKKLIGVWLDNSVHDTLTELAKAQGLKKSPYATALVERGIKKDAAAYELGDLETDEEDKNTDKNEEEDDDYDDDDEEGEDEENQEG